MRPRRWLRAIRANKLSQILRLSATMLVPQVIIVGGGFGRPRC
jgi:hypothetical protein